MKLKTEKFTVQPKQEAYNSKNVITRECALYMDDDDGTFYYALPHDLMEIAADLYNKGVIRKLTNGIVSVTTFHKIGRTCLSGVYGKSKPELEKVINYCMQEMIAVEIIEETVILYTVCEQVRFYTNEEGSIFPTPRLCDEPTALFLSSAKQHSATTLNPYYIGVGASIFVKQTTISKSQFFSSDASKVAYIRLSDDKCVERFGADSYERKLNAFEKVGDQWSGRGVYDIQAYNGLDSQGIKSIPYSPKAATFFYTYIYNLCLLAKKAQDFFFKSNELLLDRIEKNELFLPAPDETFVLATGVEIK